MSELLTAINSEVKQFLDGERQPVERSITRGILPVDNDDTSFSLEQTMFLTSKEVELVRLHGPKWLATPSWFGNIEWIKELGEDRDSLPWRFVIDAEYPMGYFEEDPTKGGTSVTCDGRWSEQYGSISGFGSHGKINTWELSFVNPDARKVTRLYYPEDPTALTRYNARYQQYLQVLDGSDPLITYRRAWDRLLSVEAADVPKLIIGGLSLARLSVEEVISQGSSPSKAGSSDVYIVLDNEPQNNDEYVGRSVTIVDVREATTERHWEDPDGPQPASDELLATTLGLVRAINRK